MKIHGKDDEANSVDNAEVSNERLLQVMAQIASRLTLKQS